MLTKGTVAILLVLTLLVLGFRVLGACIRRPHYSVDTTKSKDTGCMYVCADLTRYNK